MIYNNNFYKDKGNFIINKYRKYLATYKINQWCKSINMSPHTKIGRKLINKKYDELFD